MHAPRREAADPDPRKSCSATRKPAAGVSDAPSPRMPFQLGPHSIRNTVKYLEAGSLVFKERVKVMTVYYNVDEYAERLAEAHPAQTAGVKRREWYTKGGA